LTVVVVEDHAFVRELLRTFLADCPDITVVGEAATAAGGTALIEEHRPTIVLLDISLPSVNGLEVARQVPELSPETRILALSAYDYPQYVEAAFRAGARGYLLKTATAGEVVEALRAVGRGETVLDPNLSDSIARILSGAGLRESVRLTPREIEVLRHVARGRRNHEIAEHLGVATSTIETHVKNIFEKLGASNRTQAVELARAHNLLNGGPGT